MKALSLIEPWATLVVTGEKKVETRSWATSYRGIIGIHASKKFDAANSVMGENSRFFQKSLENHGFYYKADLILRLGCMLGTVEIIDCLPITHFGIKGLEKYYSDNLFDKEIAFGNYAAGRFAWILDNPIVFDKPIPAKGALSLWEWKEATV